MSSETWRKQRSVDRGWAAHNDTGALVEALRDALKHMQTVADSLGRDWMTPSDRMEWDADFERGRALLRAQGERRRER